MARGTLAAFADNAFAAGLSPDTPALAVAAATRQDERRIADTLARLPARLAELPPGEPVIAIIGAVTREAAAADAPAYASSGIA
jgi:uroporphyrin-III C-methyltransferase/precorrin-2 dehydrogenase/sirohydrochlorin ferrochelatase